MDVFICAVKDRALNAFTRWSPAPSLGVAIRAFTDAINNREDPMNSHPDDYDLYHLGFVDDGTGVLVPLAPPVQLALGKQVFIGGK